MTVQEALGLSDAEMAVIDIKVALICAMARKRGRRKKLTRAEVDLLIGEGTMETIITTLVALGFTKRQLVREIAKAMA
jgi:hypothetical protein